MLDICFPSHKHENHHQTELLPSLKLETEAKNVLDATQQNEC